MRLETSANVLARPHLLLIHLDHFLHVVGLREAPLRLQLLLDCAFARHQSCGIGQGCCLATRSCHSLSLAPSLWLLMCSCKDFGLHCPEPCTRLLRMRCCSFFLPGVGRPAGRSCSTACLLDSFILEPCDDLEFGLVDASKPIPTAREAVAEALLRVALPL